MGSFHWVWQDFTTHSPVTERRVVLTPLGAGAHQDDGPPLETPKLRPSGRSGPFGPTSGLDTHLSILILVEANSYIIATLLLYSYM